MRETRGALGVRGKIAYAVGKDCEVRVVHGPQKIRFVAAERGDKMGFVRGLHPD